LIENQFNVDVISAPETEVRPVANARLPPNKQKKQPAASNAASSADLRRNGAIL
jgi:hypothetical protein